MTARKIYWEPEYLSKPVNWSKCNIHHKMAKVMKSENTKNILNKRANILL